MYKIIDQNRIVSPTPRLQFSTEQQCPSRNSGENLRDKHSKNRLSKSRSFSGSCEKRYHWTPKTKTGRKSQENTKSQKKTRSISIAQHPRTYKKKKQIPTEMEHLYNRVFCTLMNYYNRFAQLQDKNDELKKTNKKLRIKKRKTKK